MVVGDPRVAVCRAKVTFKLTVSSPLFLAAAAVKSHHRAGEPWTLLLLCGKPWMLCGCVFRTGLTVNRVSWCDRKSQLGSGSDGSLRTEPISSLLLQNPILRMTKEL